MLTHNQKMLCQLKTVVNVYNSRDGITVLLYVLNNPLYMTYPTISNETTIQMAKCSHLTLMYISLCSLLYSLRFVTSGMLGVILRSFNGNLFLCKLIFLLDFMILFSAGFILAKTDFIKALYSFSLSGPNDINSTIKEELLFFLIIHLVKTPLHDGFIDIISPIQTDKLSFTFKTLVSLTTVLDSILTGN
ncbi:hypothetical protein MRV_0050 [Murid herpesvirus 3]|uniref:Uncharacterized protein n=2 Tax=Murid betaherpesvirus 3 TaxID=2560603 RepID=A0A1P8VIU0_9BETA|nr:hypothetical protein MRV_0050 [Murine roseolovirus]APZ76261.1 hypothetical protein MRV_0050 [Murid betaherpesvirus 3]AYH64791.1 hypothetical protein MRV_0050 [Murid herpesvirus 3]